MRVDSIVMSDYIDELSQEVPGLFGFPTSTEIVIFLVQHNIAKFFDYQLRALLADDIAFDIPDLQDLQHILLSATDHGLASAEFANTLHNINQTDRELYLASASVWAFIVAATSQRDGNTAGTAHLKAHVMLKLMIAVWQYGVANEDASWGVLYQEHYAINDEDTSDSEDSEDYETDEEI